MKRRPCPELAGITSPRASKIAWLLSLVLALIIATPTLALAEETSEERLWTLRRDRLNLHQTLAIGALGGMALTGITGAMLTPDARGGYSGGLTGVHVASALSTAILYGSAATLALTAPQVAEPSAQEPGYDSSYWHKSLSWVHAAGLGSTLTLGALTLANQPSLSGAHRAAAITTTLLMTLSGGLLVFEF